MKTTVIRPAEIVVQGQTSGEWVSLGVHQFVKDGKNYVEVSNAKGDGYVVADAVLFIPK